jgi:integrase
MPSSWIETYTGPPSKRTGKKTKRHRVKFRLGGRTSPHHRAGSFATRREALIRQRWIDGELAAGRVPMLNLLVEAPQADTLAEAARRYRESRVDIADNTKSNMRVALDQVVGALGPTRRVDEVTAQEVADAISKLTADGYARETIRKGVNYLGATLDFAGIEPNPAKDKLRVRLPRGEPRELEPPTADHVEAIFLRLPEQHRLPLLWLEWSGARVGSVDQTLVGDYDQDDPERRVRLRAAVSKTRRGLWVPLPDALADAIDRTLPHPKFRDPTVPLFADSSSDALRTAIAKACKAAGVPPFSPHDLRHRRISVLHRQGRSWAEIGEFVGQRSLKVTSDTYTHVIADGRELNLPQLLREVS